MSDDKNTHGERGDHDHGRDHWQQQGNELAQYSGSGYDDDDHDHHHRDHDHEHEHRPPICFMPSKS
jgi:hypothetical protein